MTMPFVKNLKEVGSSHLATDYWLFCVEQMGNAVHVVSLNGYNLLLKIVWVKQGECVYLYCFLFGAEC